MFLPADERENRRSLVSRNENVQSKRAPAQIIQMSLGGDAQTAVVVVDELNTTLTQSSSCTSWTLPKECLLNQML